jgi:glycosyltransferase involved in cell wall biosynthesis
MNTPKVSVVMSVFNGERFLRESVDSILNQSFRDFEFIIIDDGSSDCSHSILDAYAKRDSRVRVYHQGNKGLVDALNRGCSLARGKYVARMDADDIAIEHRLRWQVDFMDHHPEIAVVAGGIELINATGKSLKMCPIPTSDSEIKSALLESCTLCHPTVFMRIDAFRAVNGYRKAVVEAEDYDLWLRIADRFNFSGLKVIVLKYRLHSYQVTVRKCRNLVVSSLCARAAALERKKGRPDPLDTVGEITPALLSTFGVSEAAWRTAVSRYYLTFIRNMYVAGEYAAALSLLLDIFQSSDWQRAETWIVADLRLLAARLYWRENRLGKSVFAAAHAIITRPIILGRPAKQLFQRLRLLAA